MQHGGTGRYGDALGPRHTWRSGVALAKPASSGRHVSVRRLTPWGALAVPASVPAAAASADKGRGLPAPVPSNGVTEPVLPPGGPRRPREGRGARRERVPRPGLPRFWSRPRLLLHRVDPFLPFRNQRGAGAPRQPGEGPSPGAGGGDRLPTVLGGGSPSRDERGHCAEGHFPKLQQGSPPGEEPACGDRRLRLLEREGEEPGVGVSTDPQRGWPRSVLGRWPHWGRACRMAFTSSATAVSANSNCSWGREGQP